MAKYVSLEKTDDRIHTWISFQSHHTAGLRRVFRILHTGINILKNGILVNFAIDVHYFTHKSMSPYTHISRPDF